MKIIKISDELYERLAAEKNGESFSRFIEKLMDGIPNLPGIPAQGIPTSPASPASGIPSSMIPIEDTEDEDIEDGRFDLKLECCKKLLTSEGKLACKHWQFRGSSLMNTITRKLSYEYDEDGTWNPEC